MPTRKETRDLPYAPEQMFDLVADIEQYPLFVPWCRRAVVLDRCESEAIVDLDIGVRSFSGRFRSHVRFKRPCEIRMRGAGGGLAHLEGAWRFSSASSGGCVLSLELDFRFTSALLGAMMDSCFDRAFRDVSRAFEQRAKALCDIGKKDDNSA